MPRRPSPDLKAFLEPYDAELRKRCLAARKVILERAPGCWELLYQTYAASTAFSFSEELKHAFCHVAVYKKHVNLGFNRGTELEDPEGLLEGTGKLIRHLRLSEEVDLEQGAVPRLIDAAIENMRERMAERGEAPTRGKVVVKQRKG